MILNVTLIHDGETINPALIEELGANLISGLGKKTPLTTSLGVDYIVVNIPWVDGRLPGCYSLELKGTINSLAWASIGNSIIRYTSATEVGSDEVTVEGDAYDVTMEVGYYYTDSPIARVEVSVDDEVGTPSAEATYEHKVLGLAFHNLKGEPGEAGNGIVASSEEYSQEDGGENIFTFTDTEGTQHVLHTRNGHTGRQGIPGEGAIWDGDAEVLTELEQKTGVAINKTMSQYAITEAIKSQIESVDTSSADLEVSDNDGSVLASLSDGHVKTKNFDSRDLGFLEQNVGMGSYDEFSASVDYVTGDVVLHDGLLYKFIADHSAGAWDDEDVEQTNIVNQVNVEHPVDVGDASADFDLSDDNGYVLASFSEGHLRTKNFDSRDLSRLEQIVHDALTEEGNTYYGEKISIVTHKYSSSLLFTESDGGQGACCYGGYLFQFFNTNNKIDIYRMSTKTKVQQITLTAVQTYHCNNANFGNEYYDEGDTFPLLYVSMENASEHKALVYRVTVTGGVFAVTLVQTITFPTPSNDFLWYPNAFIDCERSKMIIAGLGNNPWSSGTNNILIYKTFPLPTLSDGDTTLDISDLEDTFMASGYPTTQGGFILNGRLYQVLGGPTNARMIAVDLQGHKVASEIDLVGDGLAIEPEGCFVDDDAIHINFVNGKIYKLKF